MSNPDTPAPALEPCPNCGYDMEVLPTRSIGNWEWFAAKCPSCKLTAPEAETEAEAIALSNSLPRATAGEQVQRWEPSSKSFTEYRVRGHRCYVTRHKLVNQIQVHSHYVDNEADADRLCACLAAALADAGGNP